MSGAVRGDRRARLSQLGRERWEATPPEEQFAANDIRPRIGPLSWKDDPA